MEKLPLTAGLQANHDGAIRTWEVVLPPTRRVRSIREDRGDSAAGERKKGMPRNA
jgi:hypothetical protein